MVKISAKQKDNFLESEKNGNQISTKDKKSITNQTFDKIIEYYTQNKDINLDQTQITNYLGILEEFNTKTSRYNRSDMFSNNDYINFITKQQNNFVFTCNYDKAKINRNIILNHIQKIRNNINNSKNKKCCGEMVISTSN